MAGFLLLLAFLTLGFRLVDVLAEPAPATKQTEDSPFANIAVLTHALQLIRQDYVDDKKIGYQT